MTSTKTILLSGVMVLGLHALATHAQTVLVADNYNVAGSGTGFGLNAGVNSGINPPTTRLTGTAAANLRYFKVAGNRNNNLHYITNSSKFAIGFGTALTTVSIRPESGIADFSPYLPASPATPSVYEVRIDIANLTAGTTRCGLGISSTPGGSSLWDFGIQLYRASTANDFYTVAKRLGANVTGGAAINATIGTAGTFGEDVSFLIRVTDAGAESFTYSSRVQVSVDDGATWLYDTMDDATHLPNGFRFPAIPRFIYWQAETSSGPVTYDNFSITLISGPEQPPRALWTGGGADANWSTAENWDATSPGPLPAFFDGATRLANTNDLPVLVVPWVGFGSGGFELHGNPVTVTRGVLNLAGVNTIHLDTDWTVYETEKYWDVAAGSELIVSGSIVSDNDANHHLTGGGTLRVTKSYLLGVSVGMNPNFEIDGGKFILDGASYSAIGAGVRFGSDASSTAHSELVLTNGSDLVLQDTDANLRVGTSARSALNRLVIHDSTVVLNGATVAVPYAGGATGEVVQVGGSLSRATVNFSQNGDGQGTYSINDGVLEPIQIRKNRVGGYAAMYFDNALIRTSLGAQTAFITGLDVAEIQAGGLILDITQTDVVIAQALSGVGGLTKSGGLAATMTGTNTYTGPTIVEAGKLVLQSGQSYAAVEVRDYAELRVDVIAPDTSLSASGLTLGSASLTIALGSLPNPVTPPLSVGPLAATGVVTINVDAGSGLDVGQFPLIDYTGAIGGGFASFVLGSIPPGVTAQLVNNTANSSIDLLITAAPGLNWKGNINSVWDVGTTTNWINAGDGLPTTYSDGQTTRFKDDAVTGNVTLTGFVFPGSVTVQNDTLPYVIAGNSTINTVSLSKNGTNSLTRIEGDLDQIWEIHLNQGSFVLSNAADATFSTVLKDSSAGAGTFVKACGTTLTIAGDNSTYDGAILVQEGTLRLGAANALGSTNGVLTIANGASLDVNNTQAPHKPVVVSGAGVNGEGAIVNLAGSGGVQNNLTDVTMIGDTTFGCVAGSRWDIRVRNSTGVGPGLRGNGYNLTKVGGGTLSISSQRHTYAGQAVPYWEMNLGDILVSEGFIAFEESISLGNPSRSLVLMPGTSMNFFDLGATNPILRTITVTDASITCGGQPTHTNILNGPIEMSGDISIRPNNGATLRVNGVMSGNASLSIGAQATGPGIVLLNAVNTFTGDAVVTNSIFGGNGTLAGNLVVAGGSLAPGAGIGTFTVNGDVTLQATTAMELNPGQSPNCDQLVVGGNLTLGGVLDVVLAPGAVLPQAGEVFQLFSKGGAGAFSQLNLPDLSSLPGNLSWKTDDLAVSGRISVVAATTAPTIDGVSLSGGELVLSGAGGIEGNTYYVLTSTNVSAPMVEWLPLATNVFGPGGSFSFTNAAGTEPESFFRLEVP